MNPILAERFRIIQKRLLTAFESVEKLPSAVAGAEREVFLREFLAAMFPQPFRFSTGVIMDGNGNLSGQVDIALEIPYGASFPLAGAGNRLMLAEFVALVIEVKSDLSKQWGQVIEQVRKIKALRRSYDSGMSGGGRGIGFQGSPHPPVIVVGYHGPAEPEVLLNKLNSTKEDERPDVAFVVESGSVAKHRVRPNGQHVLAEGTVGFFALMQIISETLSHRTMVTANFDTYFGENPEAIPLWMRRT